MGDGTAFTLLASFVIIIALVAAVCHYFGLWTWAVAWFYSTTEEKIGLTRSKGHYNANGYLIHSDSDIQLDTTTGSFKRFDSVDKDFGRVAYTTTSLAPANVDWSSVGGSSHEPDIPPQPLRLAPAPLPPTPPPREITPPKIPPRPDNSVEKITFEDLTTGIARLQYQYCSPSPSTNPFISAPESTCTETLGASMNGFHQPPTRIPEPPSTNGTTITPPTSASITGVPEPEDIPPPSVLKRAVSCDSVCSDTSVNLENLEESNTTGYLCVGLEYDSECCDLAVSVLEAKDLKSPLKTETPLDTYIKVFFLPDKSCNVQTRVYRNSDCPSYKERFLFGMRQGEASQRALSFHVYSTDKNSHALVGEAEIRLGEMSLRQPVTTWLTLTDTGQKGTEFGEVLFSLSYLPTAERLTVVIVKARNLRFPNEKDYADTFIKVYLLQHGKKVHKKKTSTKKGERSPIFNEAMIFSVPAHTLQTIQLRVTVAEASISESGLRCPPIGHVIVSSQASGRALSHWNQMLSALRKPVAMWHPLRK